MILLVITGSTQSAIAQSMFGDIVGVVKELNQKNHDSRAFAEMRNCLN